MLEKLQLPSIIKGEVTFRHKTVIDADALWEILDKHRNILGKYLNSPREITTHQVMVKSIASDMVLWEKGEKFSYCVLCQDNPVGIIEIIRIDYKHHSAEFGYWLSPSAHGQGYIYKSLKLLENELVKRDVVRLTIGCHVENIASARVAQRNGYQFEGIFRKSYCLHGQFTDTQRFAKINPAY